MLDTRAAIDENNYIPLPLPLPLLVDYLNKNLSQEQQSHDEKGLRKTNPNLKHKTSHQPHYPVD